jgi:hypothetical protein
MAPLTRMAPSRRKVPFDRIAPAAAALAALALAGCGGGGRASSASSATGSILPGITTHLTTKTPAPASAGSTGVSGSAATPAAALIPALEHCRLAWNAPANQSQRYAFDLEVAAAAGTPRARMLLLRVNGNCALVYAGATSAPSRVWTDEAGIWSVQQIYQSETALVTLARKALVQPNVSAQLQASPNDQDPTLGTLVPV